MVKITVTKKYEVPEGEYCGLCEHLQEIYKFLLCDPDRLQTLCKACHLQLVTNRGLCNAD
jgi:hypothetical protein